MWSATETESKSKAGLEILSDMDESAALLGQVLVDSGKLDHGDIERIVKYARDKKLRFGEAAKKLRLVSQHDIDNALARQFDYPVLDEGAGGYSSELVTAFKPFSEKSQAISNLRSKLLRYWQGEDKHALAIMGSHAKEGTSYLAANLAVVFSQLGHRTLLVDADLRAGRQHQVFNVPNKVGLSAVLVGRTPAESVIRSLPLFRDLSLLTAGAPPPNPAELLGRGELKAVVQSIQKDYDIVIFDTPAMISNHGAESVAAACGNVLTVVRKRQTRVADAQAMIDAVRSTGSVVVGSVMTSF